MASNRKLQGEIDRVLKQIQEHMAEFDQIWQKVHTAPTPNLKEKYEGDLKKEIKKLQRLRDQIKSWAANSDIKNKKPLLDARKAIETEMERFKVLEKESKTKAYSKEGLTMRRGPGGVLEEERAEGRDDPAKKETFMWLDLLEDKLQAQLADMEERMEGLRATSKKKKSSAITTDALTDELQAKMDRHAWHLERLGRIKDRLEHDELAVGLVEDIRDDLDYYANAHADADFQHDETLYDALDLDREVPERGGDDEGEDEAGEAEDDAAGSGDAGADDATAAAGEEDEEEGEAAAGTVGAILKNAGAKATPTKAKATSKTAAASSSATAASSSSAASSASSSAASSSTAAGAAKARTAAAGPTPVVPASSPGTPGKGDTLASIVMKNQKQTGASSSSSGTTTAAAPQPQPSPPATAAGAAKAAAAVGSAPAAAPAAAPKAATPTAAAAAAAPPTSATAVNVKPTGQLPTIAPSQLGRLPPGGSKPPTPSVQPPPGLSTQTPPPGLGTGVSAPGASAAELSGLPTSGLLSGGSSGAAAGASGAASSFASSAATKDRSLVPDDYALQLQLADASLRNLPDPFDSDRPKQYIPRNPYRTPSYFPSVPAPVFDDPLLFDKLSVDTLFFIFYFQQGTPHQYLSARELKKQSWRYHKNFLTWFQRHDDPKLTTDEFEQGTYVYFDYESGWVSRIKADFTFEYRHLEDELQVPTPSTI